MIAETKPAISTRAYIGAVAAGLAAALAAGGIWYGITVATDTAYGIVAMGIGFIVGQAVYFGSGRQRHRTLQFIAAAFGLLGVICGYFLLSSHWLDIAAAEQGGYFTLADKVRLFPLVMKETTGLLDIAFILLGIMYAWRVPRPVPTRQATPPGAPSRSGTATQPDLTAAMAPEPIVAEDTEPVANADKQPE